MHVRACKKEMHAKKEAAEGTQALAVATDAATNVVKQEKVEIIAARNR